MFKTLCEMGKVDDLGRLILAKSIREAAGINYGDKICTIYDIDDGEIRIIVKSKKDPERFADAVKNRIGE